MHGTSNELKPSDMAYKSFINLATVIVNQSIDIRLLKWLTECNHKQ